METDENSDDGRSNSRGGTTPTSSSYTEMISGRARSFEPVVAVVSPFEPREPAAVTSRRARDRSWDQKWFDHLEQNLPPPERGRGGEVRLLRRTPGKIRKSRRLSHWQQQQHHELQQQGGAGQLPPRKPRALVSLPPPNADCNGADETHEDPPLLTASPPPPSPPPPPPPRQASPSPTSGASAETVAVEVQPPLESETKESDAAEMSVVPPPPPALTVETAGLSAGVAAREKPASPTTATLVKRRIVVRSTPSPTAPRNMQV